MIRLKTLGRQSGFTLVEIMIALVLSGIIIAAIYAAYRYQRDSYEAQTQLTAMQQDIRNATWIMVREFRMAGYNPTQNVQANLLGIQKGPTPAQASTKSRLHFTMDITNTAGGGNPDGKLDGPNEDIIYGFSNADDPDDDGLIAGSNVATLGRDTGGGFQPIAENIQAIEFNYVMKDGVTKTINPSPYQLEKQVKAVEITILARTPLPDKNFKNVNMIYTTPGNQNWGPYNDNYRRLLMTTAVEGRNLGL